MLREIQAGLRPKFVDLIEANHGAFGGTASDIKNIIEESFQVSVKRGLNDNEFALLLQFFSRASIGVRQKQQLLQNIVPSTRAPSKAIKQFLGWFISNHSKIEKSVSVSILQWIIGLLEYNLIDPTDVDHFYFKFYKLLSSINLVPYISKLLCKLTKPDDVTSMTKRVLFNSLSEGANDNYLTALLNVFQGYKPQLILEDVKRVDIHKILKSVPQKMDTVMKVRSITNRQELLPFRGKGVIEMATKNLHNFQQESNKISTLIPLPRYDLEGLDQFGNCYYPVSIDEAFRSFNQVPLPLSILSLLRNEVGFFMITYHGIEIQMRFCNRLLQTLQNVFINDDTKTPEDDKEFLLSRLNQLQRFMQQGVPSASIFLAGYLLNWDGLDYRHLILSLIEWTTFHSYKDLYSNVLRPLHMLFVSYNVTMKIQIIQTLTNLIKNMFVDVRRSQQGREFPFMKRAPAWTKHPMTMLVPLITWIEELIKLGLCLEPNSWGLLIECIRFYEIMNYLETGGQLPLFTVISQSVVFRILLSVNVNAINKLCCLLLRYHRDFLPKLRTEQPYFYKQCREKMSLTAYYAREIISFLQSGQVIVDKEKGIIVRELPEESITCSQEPVDLSQHISFMPLVLLECSNGLSINHPDQRNRCFNLVMSHLKDAVEFVHYFSPQKIPESMTQ